MAGEHLDISSEHQPPPLGGTGVSPVSGGNTGETPVPSGRQRRFIGIYFACCDVYTRVYVNRTETAYEGRCPKCARAVREIIGPGGTDCRFFTAH